MRCSPRPTPRGPRGTSRTPTTRCAAASTSSATCSARSPTSRSPTATSPCPSGSGQAATRRRTCRCGTSPHRSDGSRARVMVKPDSQDRSPAAQREMPGPAGPRRWAAAAQDRYQGSLAQSFVLELKTLDFAEQIILFGAGLLVSLLPFLILLSAFASARVDDDISLRLGLNQRASGIVSHLFTSSPAVLNVATVTSLIFVAAGTLAVASSLQQIYE